MTDTKLILIQGGKAKPRVECDSECCVTKPTTVSDKKVWVITNAAQLLQAMADGITKEELNEVLREKQ